MSRSRLLLLVLMGAAGFGGCPTPTAPSSALPPAGLAGAPGNGVQTPSVHMPTGHGAPAASQPSGQHPWAAQPAGQAHATPGFGDVKVPANAGAVELEGEVLESSNVKEYTYLRIKRDDGTEDWAAVMQTTVATGQRVKVSKEIWMSNFNSPTLGRTFDKILFGRLLP